MPVGLLQHASPRLLAVSEPIFTGVGVALLTVFTEDLAVDAGATADLAATLVDRGVDAVLLAGTTGEAAALAPDERIVLIDAVRGALDPDGPPLVVGTGAPSAHQAVTLTRAACDHGADAVLALSPPMSTDPRPYYRQVVDAAGTVPVLAYHFPAVSPPGIPLEMLRELPVRGCKDSSGDADRLLTELAHWNGELYPGAAPLTSLAGGLGCPGVILALANAEPERCARAFAGDHTAQLELADPHATASTRFPHGIKELTARRFGTPVHARLG